MSKLIIFTAPTPSWIISRVLYPKEKEKKKNRITINEQISNTLPTKPCDLFFFLNFSLDVRIRRNI